VSASSISTETAHSASFRRRKAAGRVFSYALTSIVVVITFFPIYWMFVSAFQPTKYSTHFPPPLYPKDISFAIFRKLIDNYPIWSWLWHSTLVALGATAIVIVLSVIGAYSISSLQWRGRTGFAALLLLTQMLPEALIVVPIFKMFTHFPLIDRDLRNSFTSLSLLDAAFILPVSVWILKNLYDTIPREVQEAAFVDGAGPMRVLVQIIVPLTLPGLVAVGVVAFFYSWNEYLFAQILTPDKSRYTAAVGLGQMKSMLDTPIELQLAASMVFALPPVIFYLVLQRFIVAGITAGAVKG
jgi:multiple sugar transport system permease protein